jgi:hypothetical protein
MCEDMDVDVDVDMDMGYVQPALRTVCTQSKHCCRQVKSMVVIWPTRHGFHFSCPLHANVLLKMLYSFMPNQFTADLQSLGFFKAWLTA